MNKKAWALGAVMVLLALYVAVAAAPPLGEAALRTVAPLSIGVVSILTIVGGTVGGHRRAGDQDATGWRIAGSHVGHHRRVDQRAAARAVERSQLSLKPSLEPVGTSSV